MFWGNTGKALFLATETVDANLGIALAGAKDDVAEVGVVDGIGKLLGFQRQGTAETEDIAIGAFPFSITSSHIG